MACLSRQPSAPFTDGSLDRFFSPSLPACNLACPEEPRSRIQESAVLRSFSSPSPLPVGETDLWGPTATVVCKSSHRYHSTRLTHPLFSYSYALFCTAQNAISNLFCAFHTLSGKHSGWGIPLFFLRGSAHVASAYTPTQSGRYLFFRRHLRPSGNREVQ